MGHDSLTERASTSTTLLAAEGCASGAVRRVLDGEVSIRMLEDEDYRAEMKFAISGQRALRQTWERGSWERYQDGSPGTTSNRTPLLTSKPDLSDLSFSI